MLTLRQIEVIRAILTAGTVKGAAEILCVSAPGISRVMKHTESVLGVRLFVRAQGRYLPTDEAKEIFAQINEVFTKVDNLQDSIDRLKRGTERIFSFASVPSLSLHVMPAAVRRLQSRFPDLAMDINVVKIEEAADYLQLKRGEIVAMSYKLDHPGLKCHQIGSGRLVALIPEAHPLAAQRAVSVQDLVQSPLVGISPKDPYGAILAEPFLSAGLPFSPTITARFGHTVMALVAQGLGLALIDEFSAAGALPSGLAVRPLTQQTSFRTYAVTNATAPLSIFAEQLIDDLKLASRAVIARGVGIA
jgi:DNA-binding transcriptional LysR family regulator